MIEELNPILKEFIEENIDLIDNDEWEVFFDKLIMKIANMPNVSYDHVSKMRQYLEAANINPIYYMSKIPDFYYYADRSITNINVPDNIIAISEGAFRSCSYLKNIILSRNLEVIGVAAFYGCDALTAIELPSNLKSIQSLAFENCPNLIKVSYNNTVQNFKNLDFIGSEIFLDCRQLDCIECLDGNIDITYYGSVILD